MSTGIYVNPLKEIHCYFGTDLMERNFVAGETGSGKSLILRGIASKYNFLYVEKEIISRVTERITCEKFIETIQMSRVELLKGIVFDLPRSEIQNGLTDFETYKWNIPVWYSLQVGSRGLVNYRDAKFFKLLSEDKNVCT